MSEVPSSLRVPAIAISAGRIAIGVAVMLAPDTFARVLGYPRSHANPTARVTGGMFGVRELALAAFVFDALDDPVRLRRVSAINAACDAGDAAVAARGLVRGEGIARGAGGTLAAALVATVTWIRVYRGLD